MLLLERHLQQQPNNVDVVFIYKFTSILVSAAAADGKW